MNEKQILNGLEIYTKGNFTNKAIVFIHGNSLNSLNFINQFNLINNIPLIAINLSGHGNSVKPKAFKDIYCIPGFVKNIKDALISLKVETCILVGHSLGGHIAIECLDEINSINGLFIFGTPPIVIPPQMDKMFLPNPNLGLIFAGKLSKEEATILANEFVNLKKEQVPALTSYILETDEKMRTNLSESVSEGKFKNEVQLLKNCKFPIAIIQGEKETMINAQYLENLQLNNLWGNKIHYIPEAGHCPQLETPELFNKLLTGYYSTIYK